MVVVVILHLHCLVFEQHVEYMLMPVSIRGTLHVVAVSNDHWCITEDVAFRARVQSVLTYEIG